MKKNRQISRFISLVIFFRTFSVFAVVMPEEIGQQIDAILACAEVSNVTDAVARRTAPHSCVAIALGI